MKKVALILVICIILALRVFPYKFETNLLAFKFITFRITSQGSTFTSGIEIKGSKGNYEVTYWAKFNVNSDQVSIVDMAIPPNWWTFAAASFGYAGLLELADLDSPVPLIFGSTKIVAEGEEKVGKYKGKKYVLYSENKPVISWVIDKKIPFALKITLLEEQIIIELEDFQLR